MLTNSKPRIVAVLAHQLRRHTGNSFSWAMRTAWQLVKEEPTKYALLIFKKVDDSIAKRVRLTSEWAELYISQGKRRKAENLRLFVDAARFILGKRATISAYADRIIQS